MAGHSHAKNVAARKAKQGAKKAKEFTKIIKKIRVAAKEGGPDPDKNSKLRILMTMAQKSNVPKDKVANALSKQADDDKVYEAIRYEGYGPAGLAFIIEASTDNRNRTAGEIRLLFTKNGGTLGESGGVSYLFKRLGMLSYELNDTIKFDDIMNIALDYNIEDCVDEHEECVIYCDVSDLHELSSKIDTSLHLAPENLDIIWKPLDKTELNLEQAQKVLKFIDALEENEDVESVSYNGSIKQKILDQIYVQE